MCSQLIANWNKISVKNSKPKQASVLFVIRSQWLKGPVHSKSENLYLLAPAQTKLMQPILASCEAPFRSNLQKKHWSSEGHVKKRI